MFSSKSNSFPRVPLAGLIGAALLLAGQSSLKALTITNVMAVNVTPSSFTILWRSGDATPAISVYADPLGVTNLAGQVGIEAFPLHTGNSITDPGYGRRRNWAEIRQKTRASGTMQMRVTRCQPNTTYYYRLTSTPLGSSPITYPASTPLPGVTTARENSFVANSQQILIEVPGVDTEGLVVTLTHSNTAYGLSAVVGDGANPNQAWFNLSDLFALTGAGNFMPLGDQEFALHLLGGPDQGDVTETVNINFTADFAVARSTAGSFGIEFLAAYLGTNIVRVGEYGSVPLSLNCNVGIAEISANLAIATDRLAEFTFENLPAAVQTATLTPQSPTNAALLVRTAPGQTLQGEFTLANLRFRAVSNQSSAFVPLQWRTMSVLKGGSVPLGNLFADSGRVVVIGPEPLVEALNVPGQRQLTVYGKPWSAYAVQYSTNLSGSGNWTDYLRFPLTNFTHAFVGLSSSISPVFYRALELQGDPPILEALHTTDATRSLLVYGQPGSFYTVQYTTNLSGVVTWRPLQNYTLTNSFRYLSGIDSPGPIIFMRLQRN